MPQSNITVTVTLILVISNFQTIYLITPLQINSKEVISKLSIANGIRNVKLTNGNLSVLDPTKPTIIVIHGWRAHINTSWIQNMTTLLLNRRICNVITVDWSTYSNSLNYPSVKAQAEQVGRVIGEFLVNLTQSAPENLENVHIIGHSLGAQVAGFAGQHVYAKLAKKVARITGLDAARPLFESPVDDQMLSSDDAHHVDAIHTNGGVLGFLQSYGTADYFVNGGGPMQPGCNDDACSHSRAHDVYIESIVSDKFMAVSCPTYSAYVKGFCNFNKTIMGDDEPYTNFGNYFLTTNAKPPYAKG